MSLSIDEYRSKLINKILFAGSQREVTRFCDAAINGLEQHNVNPHIVARFVEKVICELELFDPIQNDSQQWSNIQLAKILFKRIKFRLNKPSL